MRRCHVGLGVVAAVLACSLSGGRAHAQQTTPQQPYGYATPQTPYASPQGGGYACYPQKVGCQVNVCPMPCQTGPACQAILAQIPRPRGNSGHGSSVRAACPAVASTPPPESVRQG